MESFLPHIRKIVVVMFENRSFDNLVGWLYSTADPPENFIPADTPYPFKGLEEKKYSLPFTARDGSPAEKRTSFPIMKGTCGNGTTVPNLDPYEEYKHVNNQLFGTEKEWPEGRTPKENRDGLPGMKGFLQDYNVGWESWDEALQITQTYTPTLLPVINGLGKSFALCDDWYSSVPTQTNPNRAFFHCGTSLGRESNEHLSAVETFETDTLWNLLPGNISWKIYYHDTWPITNPLSKKCYTRHTFPNLERVGNDGNYRVIGKFFEDAENGTLPDFAFLEPKWGFGYDERISRQGNDYHPPADVRDGELFLKSIYDSLRASKCWNETLLIVTFDEHGGTWDHVSPPWGATPPDSHKGESGFEFDRFGVRVPTILVSPWIEESTVFRSEGDVPYDHTSIIATILNWAWQSHVWSEDKKKPEKTGLGNRVFKAPTFEKVLSRRNPRTDQVVVPEPPVIKGGPITLHNETNTCLYYYLGYITGITGNVLPLTGYQGRLKRGESVTYDTARQKLSWDYFVNASYWVGDRIQKPHEIIDRGYSGLKSEWRLFWADWQLLLHHQKVVFRSFPFQTELTGDDAYGGNSRICIKNESYTRIYYHLYYHSSHAGKVGGQYRGVLHRGEIFRYPTGKDLTSWDYSVEISYWVGDTEVHDGECVDSDLGIDKTWRFFWSRAKPLKHNQTLTIFQAAPGHPTAGIEC